MAKPTEDSLSTKSTEATMVRIVVGVEKLDETVFLLVIPTHDLFSAVGTRFKVRLVNRTAVVLNIDCHDDFVEPTIADRRAVIMLIPTT